MILKTTLFWVAVTMLFLGCKSASQNQASEAGESGTGMETLNGKIVQKPWTKSTESYCAQGSEYFIIEIGDKSHVLQTAEGSGIDLKSFEGKEAKLQGKFITKTISSNEESGEISQKPVDTPPFIEQKPVSGTLGGETKEAGFSCEVFEVSKIS